MQLLQPLSIMINKYYSVSTILELQQQVEVSGAEEPRHGSGMLAEEPTAGEQLREEPAVEDPAGAVDSLSRRSASMWTSDEKSSFLNCFKVPAPCSKHCA